MVWGSGGTMTWPCKGCGHRPPVNMVNLFTAADAAFDGGHDLTLGAPQFGLPQR